MNPEFKDHIIFTEPIKPSEFDRRRTAGKLGELESRPDKIIRMSEIPWREKDPAGFAENKKDLFEDLRRYGIKIPVDFLLGQTQDEKKVLYIITDRIKGKTLKETAYAFNETLFRQFRERQEKDVEHASDSPETKEKEKFVHELQELYNSLLQYYIDKYNEVGIKAGEFLYDIVRGDQFVWGTKEQKPGDEEPGDEEKHIYLIDTDCNYTEPLHLLPGHLLQETIVQENYGILIEFITAINEIENIFHVKFDVVRDKMRDFVSSIEGDDKQRFGQEIDWLLKVLQK